METLKERFEAMLDIVIECNYSKTVKDGIYYYNHDGLNKAASIEAMEQAYNMALPQWVPIGERLPDGQMPVIVHTVNGYTQTAFFEEDSESWVGIGNYRAPKVTHWMPLPPNPSKD